MSLSGRYVCRSEVARKIHGISTAFASAEDISVSLPKNPSMATGLGPPMILQVLLRARDLRVEVIIAKCFERSVLKHVKELGHIRGSSLTHRLPHNNIDKGVDMTLLAAESVGMNKLRSLSFRRRPVVTQQGV